jgi:hypothetical protein
MRKKQSSCEEKTQTNTAFVFQVAKIIHSHERCVAVSMRKQERKSPRLGAWKKISDVDLIFSGKVFMILLNKKAKNGRQIDYNSRFFITWLSFGYAHTPTVIY